MLFIWRLTTKLFRPYNASMSSPIYLDHNATTPILPEVADAVREASLKYGANPESQHELGRQARRALENARERIGELLGARVGRSDADQIVFTSGGTEANNLALLGLAAELAPSGTQQAHALVSAIEHPSITETAAALKSRGWQIETPLPNSEGFVELQSFDALLNPETQLVCLMLANNETGVLQPVAEVAQLCASHGIPLHTDAAQAVGKLPVDFNALGATSMSCTAHKFQGPLGIGVLVVRHGCKLRPIAYGGHQQSGLRPGTQNVALAIGMMVALEIWQREAAAQIKRIESLRDRLEQKIIGDVPEATILGNLARRLPNTSNIAFVGFDRQAVVMALDMAGVACSTGSACASGSSEPSPTLAAMGLENRVISGSVRFSLGPTNTPAEIDESALRISLICKHLRHAENC